MVKNMRNNDTYFDLTKIAAKEKTNRKRVVSSLEKAKSAYGKLKASLDSLEEQALRINESLEKTKSSCGLARKEMLKLHKVIQTMDLTNANEVVMYDSGDVGYVIDGKECHVDVDDSGEMKKTRMRDHRREKKNDKKDTLDASYDPALDDDSSEDEGEVVDIADINDELDSLYADFMSSASQYNSLIKSGRLSDDDDV